MKKTRFSLFYCIAAVLITALLAAGCQPAFSTVSTPIPTQTKLPLPNTGSDSTTPSVVVRDQQFKGDTIVVERIVSKGKGWIAIHIEKDGKLGEAIAFAPVNDGVNTNVTVKLDVAQASPVMYAMLHTDAGEIGKYEFPGPDVPYLLQGQMINPPFHVTAAAAGSSDEKPYLIVRDQQIIDGKVMIDEVFSPGQGWIDIHMQEDGERGKDIGFAPVKAGLNKNIVVSVDPNRVTPVLYAVLHIDAGIPGVYELPPGPDANVEVDGEVVGPTFRTDGLAVSQQPTEDPAANATQPAATAASPTQPAPTMDMGQQPAATEDPVPTASAAIPYIRVVDQPVVEGTVTVSEVLSIGETWLVIHKQNPDGNMGTLVGYTRVPDGLSRDVKVTVDQSLVTPVLYAMLHEDNEPIGELAFPGSDVPVLVDGKEFTPTFGVLQPGKNDVILNVSSDATVVKHLTNAQGMSLYISLDDQPGQRNCAGECLNSWKPLIATGRLVPGGGVDRAKLGVIILPDGTRQVTYSGLPLYASALDQKPGDINGQGLDGLWFLANP